MWLRSLQAYGVSTAVTWKSAFAGTSNSMRIKPLVSSSWYARSRDHTVETSSLGHVAPSTGRKIGSVPAVRKKRSATSGGEIPQPVACTWHDEHERPFVPSDTKNGLWTSIPPAVLTVCTRPVASGIGGSATVVGSETPADRSNPQAAVAIAAARKREFIEARTFRVLATQHHAPQITSRSV